MLMNNEISTAAHYGARVTWIVLNDAAFGITEHGMRALGYQPLEPRFPRCDFAMIAAGMGARGFTARNEVVSPFIRRIEALRAMGASG